jgi:phenylalanyl-tRNA synthetase beta chain
VTNIHRKQPRVRLFEIGRSFHADPAVAAGDWSVKGIAQPLKIAGLAYGPMAEEQWGQPSRAVDFFDVKADLEALALPQRLSTKAMEVPHPAFHPGRSAGVYLADQCIGVLGELHPAMAQKLEINPAPVLFEIDLLPLQALAFPVVSEVSKFPAASRDLAILLPLATPAGAILDRLNGLKSQLKQGLWIQNIKCFDEYRGKGLAENEKSLAFRFILQSPETTLQDSEVDALMNDILHKLQSEFGARLRS